MIKTEPIIAVEDVKKSSSWYQRLLNCKSGHGGEIFEILMDKDDNQILSLHKWGNHDHPTMNTPKDINANGLILYFLVEDLKLIWKNTLDLNAKIESKPHLNKNSGRMEFSIRDLDNYYISVCSENI